MTQQH